MTNRTDHKLSSEELLQATDWPTVFTLSCDRKWKNKTSWKPPKEANYPKPANLNSVATLYLHDFRNFPLIKMWWSYFLENIIKFCLISSKISQIPKPRRSCTVPTDPTDLQEVPVEAVPGLTALPSARPAAVSRRGGSAHGDVPPQTDTDWHSLSPASLLLPTWRIAGSEEDTPGTTGLLNTQHNTTGRIFFTPGNAMSRLVQVSQTLWH